MSGGDLLKLLRRFEGREIADYSDFSPAVLGKWFMHLEHLREIDEWRSRAWDPMRNKASREELLALADTLMVRYGFSQRIDPTFGEFFDNWKIRKSKSDVNAELTLPSGEPWTIGKSLYLQLRNRIKAVLEKYSFA